MSEFRIGTATSEPAAGTLKVGSGDVQEIYLGSTKIWPAEAPLPPGEVQLGSLIWTDANSTIVASSGGTIPILTTGQQAADSYANSTPGAVYWNFDPAETERGLFYNKVAAANITPPAGFRFPTTNDWSNLITELSAILGTTNNVTAGGGGSNAFWNQTIKGDAVYGTSGFNSIKAGSLYLSGTNLIFSGVDETWWTAEGTTTPLASGTAFTEQPSIIQSGGAVSAVPFWSIRFCKDA